MEIDVRTQGNVYVVRMRGQLKLGEPVEELRNVLDGVLAEGHTSVVANLAGVPMADSSGIGTLIRYQSLMNQKGGAIKLVQPSKLVIQTLKILGLLNLFEIFDDENAAVSSFPDAAAAE